MAKTESAENLTTVADVAICGGGLSGLLLARQIRQELPELSVVILEATRRPLPESCHKVGESSVELGSQYLERLGLADYLRDTHIYKLGLRFFPGGGHQPLHERTEIGPCAEPIVHSYQLDRGVFESDLREFADADGTLLIEGARVTDVDLDADTAHKITYKLDSEVKQLKARWIVDATGRNALLRRKHKSTRKLPHKANSGWYRVKGRVDICDMVPPSVTTWHARALGDERWRSTNHFMGVGYWAWVIPLSTGNTSIGLVVHDEVHGHKCIASFEAMCTFLQEHEPHLAKLLDGRERMDYLCLRDYANSVGRTWSDERWAIVGEAGAFVDPLYSPGTDFIAFANCFTTEMLHVDNNGGDLAAKATQLNTHYRLMVTGITEVFRRAAPVYGHPSAMATKVFWDDFVYWCYTCHFFQQDLCKLNAEQFAPFGVVGQRFVHLANQVQALLRSWADLGPEEQKPIFIGAPAFPSILIDAHLKLTEKWTAAKTLQYMQMRIEQGEVIVGEIALRLVLTIGPVLGKQVLDEAKFWELGIQIDEKRILAEKSIGLARRKQLSAIALDVERTLGKVVRHAEADLALDLFREGIPT
jgi:flavin-dependent dehydrogenase